jgi:hypothetical protein
MSADNGVYILVSRGRKTRHGYKKEYRVTHAQAIENIQWQPGDGIIPGDEEIELSPMYVRALFGNARVFTDRRIAEGYAQRIYDEHTEDGGVVEYGIRFLDYSHIRFPKKQEAGSRDRSQAVVG